MSSDWPISTSEELLARVHDKTTGLPYAEMKVFSQNGEDGILFEIFKRLESLLNGVVVEFGVEDGLETCSRFLIEKLGWKGLYIECDSADYKAALKNFKGNPNLKIIKEYVSENNINKLIDENLDGDIDLIIIDIDGVDYKIFNAVDKSPKLFVVEYNGSLPHDVNLVNESADWDESANFGASLRALEIIADKKGYTLIHTDQCGVNSFFIRNDLVHLFPEHIFPLKRNANYGLIGYQHPNLDLNLFIPYE